VIDPEIDGPFDPDYEYSGNVIDGLNYLFSQMISDADGVHFPVFYDVYSTGIVMMAVAASNDPGRVVNVPGSAVDDWTYQEVLEDMLAWMAFAQNTGGCEIGGWGYTGPHLGWSDNSNSGYATLGLGFAAAVPPEGFGLTIPAGVLTLLDQFIDNVQVAAGPFMGGSIYNPCWGGPPDLADWTNTLKTGNLLYELGLVGDSVGSARVDSAINFIATYWANNGGDCDGCGWRDDYQAMFTMMKGLQSQGVETLPGDIDWFDEVSTDIVTNQQDDGYWTGGVGRGDDLLKTAWALLTLEKVVPTFVVITLEPDWAENLVGEDHTVTATVTDLFGTIPQPGILVSFMVTFGPNAGEVSDPGECTVDPNCNTDANGQVSWSYIGSVGVGTDVIQASFINEALTPLDFSSLAVEEDNRPLPRELNTPPVTNKYLGIRSRITRSKLIKFCSEKPEGNGQ